MIHSGSLPILGVFLIGLACAQGRCGDIENHDSTQRILDELRDLRKTLSELVDPKAASRPSGTKQPMPENGRIKLVNDWDREATYYINGQLHVVGPRQQLVLDVPAGTVRYEIWGDGVGVVKPVSALSLIGGQSWTVHVYPLSCRCCCPCEVPSQGIPLRFRDMQPSTKNRDLPTGARDLPGSALAQKARPLSGPLAKMIADPEKFYVPTQEHPRLHDFAPPFELPNHLNRPRSLKQILPRPVVLVFYEFYECGRCVANLKALKDNIAYFDELDAEVFAISPDPPEKTSIKMRQFVEFPFPVLSDEGNKVAQLYDVFIKGKDGQADMPRHGTFVIDQFGRIDWAYRGEVPFTDKGAAGNRTLLYELARIQGRLPSHP